MNENNEDWIAIKRSMNESGRKVNFYENENPRSETIIKWAKIERSQNEDLYEVIMNSDGIIVDDWIHILGHGSGDNGLSVFVLENLPEGDIMKDALVVAVDVLGGLFAICRDKDAEEYGDIMYFEPEFLEWTNAEMGYSEFLIWATHDDIDGFYEDVRWEKWRELSGRVGLDAAISFDPPIWMEDCDVSASSREIVPFKQLLEMELLEYVKSTE
ncbi:DUF2625 family protein [Candidatus Saccharibacteria bacterium]|nr:DUF2625 family protein [Candidatus Saccharibacteria bacterium]